MPSEAEHLSALSREIKRLSLLVEKGTDAIEVDPLDIYALSLYVRAAALFDAVTILIRQGGAAGIPMIARGLFEAEAHLWFLNNKSSSRFEFEAGAIEDGYRRALGQLHEIQRAGGLDEYSATRTRERILRERESLKSTIQRRGLTPRRLPSVENASKSRLGPNDRTPDFSPYDLLTDVVHNRMLTLRAHWVTAHSNTVQLSPDNMSGLELASAAHSALLMCRCERSIRGIAGFEVPSRLAVIETEVRSLDIR